MRISPVSFYQHNIVQKQKPVTFGFNHGDVYNPKTGELQYRVLTDFMRGDIEWDKIAQIYESKFPGDEKVHFYVIGCSSGEENFSYDMKLRTDLGPRYKKYTKIIGIDINQDNIAKAKYGSLLMTAHEKRKIENRINGNIDEYFDITKKNDNLYIVKPKPILREDTAFYKGDIRSIIDELPDDRIILSCRNMWQYLSRFDQKILLRKIAEKYEGKQYIFQLGKTDLATSDGIRELLPKYGFKGTGTDYMFEKVERGTYLNNQ